MNLKEEVLLSINNCDFKRFELLYSKMEFKFFEDLLMSLSFENKNIVFYSFVCLLLMKKECVNLHYLASSLLTGPLCYFEGAYYSAFIHFKRAIEMEPNNIELKEEILFFYEVPDQPLKKKEAIRIAEEILRIKPSSQCANRIIKQTKVVKKLNEL